MPSYKVSMVTPDGRTITDVIPADNESHILNIVKQRGNFCVDYEIVDTYTKSRVRLNLNALVVFCYQMGAMLSAGVGILEALKMIQSKGKTEKERRIYRNLYEEVQKGNALSVAMMQQDGAFDQMLISMIQSGENSGSIGEVLETMSRQYDRDKRIRSKLRSASVYPLVLLTVAVAVVLILVVFVLPGITSAFPASAMPLLTRMLLAVSNFMINQWYIVAIVVISGIGFSYFALQNKAMRIVFDRAIVHAPIIGNLLRTVYSSRCARSFASLYKHGVPALKMIELTSKVLGNTYLEREFERVYVNVSRGEYISDSIESISEFDIMLSSMIRVGEETGDLEAILSRTAVYFDEEAEGAMTRLVGLVEPAMIVVLGVLVAIIVVAIIQPIFTMYQFVE